MMRADIIDNNRGTVPTAVLNSYQLTTVAHLMIDYSSSAES